MHECSNSFYHIIMVLSSRPEVTGIGAEGSQVTSVGQQERSEVSEENGSGQVETANTQDSFECV